MTRQRTVVLALVVVLLVVVVGTVTYVELHSSSSTSPSPGPSGVAVCPTSPTGLTSGNWTTYHQNNARGGDLAGSPITSAAARWPGPVTLDGQVYAEPLVCGDSLYVATEDNSVYALNATTGSVLWHTHLGTPVAGSSLPCGDIDPSGITGTPVIDVATGTLYAVAYLPPYQHTMFALNVANGSIRSHLLVNPPGANQSTEQQRGALGLANGVVYIPYGGLDGDCAGYHGWVVGAPTNGSTQLLSYQVPTHREGGIWGTGGMVINGAGDVFVATGNGDSTTTFDHGDAVIELSPTLHELGYFAPTNWVQLNKGDTDLGSLSPTLLPNGDIFQVGKEGVGYLLSGTDLGGIGGQVFNASVCGGAYGGTAHVGMTVLVPCTDGVTEVDVNATNFSVVWHSTGFDAGSPIVTGNIVWSVDIYGGALVGLNYTTGKQVFSFPIGSVDHFISPTAAPGSVYVAAEDDLYCFALG
jgi:polyvinyl alcohol dehydrogenase (cytochrome)